MHQKHFTGVLTAVATPFKEDGDIDLEAFRTLVQLQKSAGISGVVVAGTTGESPTLNPEEIADLVGVALSERTQNFKVYVGTGSNDTRKSIEASRKALAVKDSRGCSLDGVMAVVPYYNKPTQGGLEAHFGGIAEAVSPAPLCIYNVPGRTASILSPTTFLKIASAHPNVAALKEASADLQAMAQLRLGLDSLGLAEKVSLLSGDDPTFAPAAVAGAEGVISVSANIIPRDMVAMLAAIEQGNLKELRRLHLLTYAVHTAMFIAPNPIPLKCALDYLGICSGRLRLPMTPLEPTERETLEQVLSEAAARGVRFVGSPEKGRRV